MNKAILLAIALSFLGAGCLSDIVLGTSDFSSPYLYPNSYFVGERTRIFLSDFIKSLYETARAIANEDVVKDAVNEENIVKRAVEFFQGSPFTDSEIGSWFEDPFIKDEVILVIFDSFDPAKDIAGYYKKVFKEQGWLVVRHEIPLELKLWGGDYIRVYKKGKKLVHLQVSGFWEKDTEEREESLFLKRICFQLIGVTPEALFGKGYAEKPGCVGVQ